MSTEYTETVFIRNTNMDIPQNIALHQNALVGFLHRIAELRKKRAWSQAELAERMGVAQPTLQRWESGKREPAFEQLFKLADVLDVDPMSLIDTRNAVSMGPRLFIKGEVAAGVWREAVEYPETEWQAFTGRPGVSADIAHRFGLSVVGDSMDLIYPAGSIVECVSVFGRMQVEPGKRVVVLRKSDHNTHEMTLRELILQDGDLWLVSRSSNPAHLPFKLNTMTPGVVEHRITAVVVASIRPE